MTMRRILIVEDEVDLLDEVASFLRRRGETVLTATSCKAGMRILKDDAAPIDVLVSDARLPDGNGVDLIRLHIERIGKHHTSILVTGHLEQSQLSADVQGVKVFSKPFAVSLLYREIKAALVAGHPVGRAAGAAMVGTAPMSSRARFYRPQGSAAF